MSLFINIQTLGCESCWIQTFSLVKREFVSDSLDEASIPMMFKGTQLQKNEKVDSLHVTAIKFIG